MVLAPAGLAATKEGRQGAPRTCTPSHRGEPSRGVLTCMNAPGVCIARACVEVWVCDVRVRCSSRVFGDPHPHLPSRGFGDPPTRSSFARHHLRTHNHVTHHHPDTRHDALLHASEELPGLAIPQGSRACLLVLRVPREASSRYVHPSPQHSSQYAFTFSSCLPQQTITFVWGPVNCL